MKKLLMILGLAASLTLVAGAPMSGAAFAQAAPAADAKKDEAKPADAPVAAAAAPAPPATSRLPQLFSATHFPAQLLSVLMVCAADA